MDCEKKISVEKQRKKHTRKKENPNKHRHPKRRNPKWASKNTEKKYIWISQHAVLGALQNPEA